MTDFRNFSRRTFGAGVAAAAAAVGSSLTTTNASAANPVLVVLMCTPLDNRVLEQQLASELSGVDVRVFGRERDFAKSLSSGVDGALALAPTLQDAGLPLHLRGVRKGRQSESYVLLAPGSVAPKSLASVGVTEVVGRKNLKGFVGKLIGNQPDVKQVTKLSDLVALLRFKEVDAVMLPEQWVGSLKSTTQMSLVTTGLGGAQVGLASFSRVGAGGKTIEDKLKRLGRSLNSNLGVESWA